jgi:hypothetical protein
MLSRLRMEQSAKLIGIARIGSRCPLAGQSADIFQDNLR